MRAVTPSVIIAAAPILILLLIPLGFVILSTIFWIVTLIDCIVNEPSEGNDKLIWVIILVFTHALGALIYRFARRPDRIRRYGR
jgi:TctA family transporter